MQRIHACVVSAFQAYNAGEGAETGVLHGYGIFLIEDQAAVDRIPTRAVRLQPGLAINIGFRYQ
jgi:hypothetical protein